MIHINCITRLFLNCLCHANTKKFESGNSMYVMLNISFSVICLQKIGQELLVSVLVLEGMHGIVLYCIVLYCILFYYILL